MSSAILQKNDEGFSVVCYRGNRSVLLAFDLDENQTTHLAGFSIHCVSPNNQGVFPDNQYCLPNLLDFEKPMKSDDKLNCKNPNASDKRPFQTFHWAHFPSAGPGKYKYTIYRAYFKNELEIEHRGSELTVDVDIDDKLSFSNFDMGFTRGYVSSQAYTEKFQNKPIHPGNPDVQFDTTPYVDQYKWLGAHARELIFDFLNESEALDVFSFDLNEPDIIKALRDKGNNLRIFQDNSSEHTGESALEPQALDLLQSSGAQVNTGHFGRYAHDKIFIQKRNGKPTKVLTGSTNFSIRGLYVQANSVLVFNDANIAKIYEAAFEQAFTDPKGFSSSNVASTWYKLEGPSNKIPKTHLSFAPHGKRGGHDTIPFSIMSVSEAIDSAKSSVFYAIMSPEGGGPVMPALENLADRQELFSVGIIDKPGQLDLFKAGNNTGVTAYKAITKNVPEPFKKEMESREFHEGKLTGQVIHHKFVVCDFNDKNAVVFCGSSNLSSGGEQNNGDNLLAIYDPGIATAYAIETIRLYDHYRFAGMHNSDGTETSSIRLKSTDEWVKPYYEPDNFKFKERQLLSLPLSRQ